jgi:protein-S-isoprenylcysteine O-methyltransferase Ste14
MKTLFIALRAAIFGTGFIFLWGWVALSLHQRYDLTLGLALYDWTRALGIALMATGGTLAFACVATFVARGEGTPAPFDPPRRFVAVGPYRFARNPMYIGGFTVLFGERYVNRILQGMVVA